MIISLSSFPQLTTERLLLRQLSNGDAEEIFLLRSNDIVNQYLNRPKAKSLEEAKDFIARINFSIDNHQSLYWAICLRDDNKLIGTICLWNFSDEENKAEIGYELLPQFHSRGIMQEAFLKVIGFGFETLQLNSIEAWTVKQNEGSIKILVRNHFKRNIQLEEKIDRSIESPDMVIYSLSGPQYLNSRF